MVEYNLEHLTQDGNQNVLGPVQDDEALFLYALIKGCLVKTVLEIGGGEGYSAKNFVAAVGEDGKVITYDVHDITPQGDNHVVIVKNAKDLNKEELNIELIDLVFFDCHDMIELDVYNKLVEENLINDETIIALHDTNLHFQQNSYLHYLEYKEAEQGWVHQPVERELVNILKEKGYDIFSLRTTPKRHENNIPYRHGITVCQKFKKM